MHFIKSFSVCVEEIAKLLQQEFVGFFFIIGVLVCQIYHLSPKGEFIFYTEKEFKGSGCEGITERVGDRVDILSIE